MLKRSQPIMADETFTVHTSLLFDPKNKAFVKNVSVTVNRQSGAITHVYTRESSSYSSDDATNGLVLEKGDIDLRGKVVMPGFVDSHTHIFIYAYKQRSGTEQMRDESAVERIVRATNHARAALLAGYTTYRDLGTEALGNTDANFRDCINRGLVPGPRLFVATDALASNGSYEVRVENRFGGQLSVPRAADAADGVDGVRAAVRRRVGDGADLIKFYADYRRKVMRFPNFRPETAPIRFLPDRPNPAVPLYSQEEMNAIVAEARLAEMPVAAHAGETRAALMAARAGVTTIEHIIEDTDGKLDELLAEMKKRGCIWVPTLATVELGNSPQQFEAQKKAVKRAHVAGVRLAAGGDTGTFDHGLNAREMEIMVELGIPIEDVLVAGTMTGWEACGGDRCGFRFGWLEPGNRADIIALDTDPRVDSKALRKVSFVMKDGEVWKADGMANAAKFTSVPAWPSGSQGQSEGGSHTDSSPRTSGEWTDLSVAQPKLEMSVPPPVFAKNKAASPRPS